MQGGLHLEAFYPLVEQGGVDGAHLGFQRRYLILEVVSDVEHQRVEYEVVSLQLADVGTSSGLHRCQVYL